VEQNGCSIKYVGLHTENNHVSGAKCTTSAACIIIVIQLQALSDEHYNCIDKSAEQSTEAAVTSTSGSTVSVWYWNVKQQLFYLQQTSKRYRN
jgi:hypothetical protein